MENKADIIIAVNVNPISEKQVRPSFKSIGERVFLLSINSRLKEMVLQPDILIEPPELAQFGYFDLKKADKIFEIGYESSLQQLNDLKLND